MREGRAEADFRGGGIELSLTVPIVNTLAFLFTVIGEWWVEKKVISRGMFSPTPSLGLCLVVVVADGVK